MNCQGELNWFIFLLTTDISVTSQTLKSNLFALSCGEDKNKLETLNCSYHKWLRNLPEISDRLKIPGASLGGHWGSGPIVWSCLELPSHPSTGKLPTPSPDINLYSQPAHKQKLTSPSPSSGRCEGPASRGQGFVLFEFLLFWWQKFSHFQIITVTQRHNLDKIYQHPFYIFFWTNLCSFINIG